MTREQLEEIKRKHSLDEWIRQEATRVRRRVSVQDVEHQLDDGIVEILTSLRKGGKRKDDGRT